MEIDFKGMTRIAHDGSCQCPAACTADRCVISTVKSCKHPCLSSNEGCGPITMANRAAARKFLGIVPGPLNHSDVVR